MSVRVMAAVFDKSEATANDRLVLLAIADEADDDGSNAYPSIDRLGHKVRLPKRTVRRCIDRLEALGELEVIRPVSQGRGHYNRYVVHAKGDTLTPFPVAEKGAERGGKGRTPTYSVPDPLTHRPVEESKDVEEVFRTWKQSTSRGDRTVLDTSRRRVIVNALKDYPLADVVDAVRGWEHSAFHRGQNDAGKKHNELTLLLRDAEHIEKFRDSARGPREPDRTNGYRRSEPERPPSAVRGQLPDEFRPDYEIVS